MRPRDRRPVVSCSTRVVRALARMLAPLQASLGRSGGRGAFGTSGHDLPRLEIGPAAGAPAPVVDLSPTAPVLDHDRGTLRRRMPVAPLEQRDQNGPQIRPFAGQPILEARRPLLILHAA